MPSFSLAVSHAYDLPRTIVWDAFVDEDLIDGWLPAGTLAGEVTALDARERVVFESDDGILDFRLSEIPTGTRGSGTDVTVTVTVSDDSDESAGVAAIWRENLDRLEELLRGHPVDWDAPPASRRASANDAADGA